LKEIEGVSAHLAALIQSLVQETEQQTHAAVALSKAMSERSAVTHQALVDTQRAAVALDDLLALSNR
jgi:flagellar hook-basal body complex protein FliE